MESSTKGNDWKQYWIYGKGFYLVLSMALLACTALMASVFVKAPVPLRCLTYQNQSYCYQTNNSLWRQCNLTKGHVPICDNSTYYTSNQLVDLLRMPLIIPNLTSGSTIP